MTIGLRTAAALLALTAIGLAGCTAGTTATPAVTVTEPGITVTESAVTNTQTATQTVRSTDTVVRTVSATKTVEHSQPAQTVIVPTTVIRLEERVSVSTVIVEAPRGTETDPPCSSDVPTIVLQAITGGLSSDGIARAAGIHAMTQSTDNPGTYLIAARFDPGGVAVWGIEGLSRFSWIEPGNALARQLTVHRVVPGSGPFIDASSFDVQRAVNCLGD